MEPPYDYQLVLLLVPEERAGHVIARAGRGAFYAARRIDPGAYRRGGQPLLDHATRKLALKLGAVLDAHE